MTATGPAQRCPRCGNTHPLDAFPHRYRGKPGNYCTECARAYRRAYYKPKPRRTCATTGCATLVTADRTHCAGHTPRPPRPDPPRSTTYRAVHKRVSMARGKAREYTCQCGAQAEQWAYNHSDPAELTQQWNGKTVTYSADVMHYDPLCRGCHVRRDGNGYIGSELERRNNTRRDPEPTPSRWWDVG